MANTFTDNFNFIKSEVGGDNQSWGNNLHSTLVLADSALAKTIEDQLMSGITSTAIDLTAGAGSTGIISTSANLKYFESVVVGDKIRVSGSSVTANGTAAAPVIHTVTAKTSADSITVSTAFTTDSSSAITVAKVLEPVHINSGPIVCAPLANLSAATRTAGGAGVPGTDATDALVANGDVTLGATNANTVTVTAKVASDLIPSADDTHNLGSSTLSWDDLHAKGTSTLGTVAISAGTFTGITVTTTGASGSPGPGSAEKVVNLAVTGQSGSFTNFNMGSNGQGAKTVSTSAPSSTTGYANGDVWYEIP
jgi:hypothetical protein